MARIRLTKCTGTSEIYKAEIRTSGKEKSGTIDAKYVNDRAKKEIQDYGFAYINRSKDFIC